MIQREFDQGKFTILIVDLAKTHLLSIATPELERLTRLFVRAMECSTDWDDLCAMLCVAVHETFLMHTTSTLLSR